MRVIKFIIGLLISVFISVFLGVLVCELNVLLGFAVAVGVGFVLGNYVYEKFEI